jgi:endonuclease/exonuclease/phosphatase family metal-dependent hydrolase
MLSAGYLDGFRYLHPLEKGLTFPTWAPQIRLDYAFVPAMHTQRLRSCQVVSDVPAATQGSDHFPLLFELQAA